MRRAAVTSAAAAAVWLAAPDARGAAASWDGGAGPADRAWTNQFNWTPDAVPGTTTDISFAGGVTPGLVIIAPTGITGADSFANSVTISSTSSFTVDGTGSISIIPGFPVPTFGRLNLTSGDLTRFDIGGALQWFDIDMMLGGDGLWQVGGTGTLQVRTIAETGGARTFTKTGTGLLLVDNGVTVTGTKTISLGTLRGAMHGAGAITIGTNGVWEMTATPTDATPVTLFGKPGTLLAPTLTALGSGTFGGAVTLIDNPTINVNPGQVLTLGGGTVNGAGNTSFTKIGFGEMVLTAAGAAAASVPQGQLTIKHNNAVGTGVLFANDISGGAQPPSVAFGDGVTNFANPISLSRAILRGVGTASTVASNITVNNAGLTVNVADAAHSLTLNGNIVESGGSFSLTKTGQGALFLGGSNTLSGGITVAEGVFGASNDNALHATLPTIIQSGARFELRNTQAISRPLNVAGTGPGGQGVITSGSGNNTLVGTVTLNGAVAFGGAAGSILNLAGPLAGAVGVTKVGDGTLTITSPLNNYTSLTIADGVFAMASATGVPAGLEINMSNGGAVSLFGNGTVNRRVNLNGLGASASIGALDNESGNNTWAGEVILLSDSTVSSRAGRLTVTGNMAGVFGLTKIGPGEVALAGANAYGNTTIAQGALTLLSAGSLPAARTTEVLPGAALRVGTGVTVGAGVSALRLNGTGIGAQGALSVAQGSGTWNGPVTLASNGAAVGAAAGATLNVSGAIGDDPAGPPILLTKVGPGTVVLSGLNTYRGGTVVNAGTLAIDADERLGAADGLVTVNAGGKLRVTQPSFTSRSFQLNNGSIEVDASMFLIYNGATIAGGFLRGPGVHGFDGAASTIGGVTALPGAQIANLAPVSLTTFSNAGTLQAGGPLTWDGGFNLGGGSVIVGASLATQAFQNDGAITINNAATMSHTGSDLASTGGSRITVNTGGTLQLNGTNLNLHGALAVNNGTIAGGTTNVHFGSMLAGAGSFGTVVVHPGGAFTPGVTLANLAAAPPPPAITGAIDPLDPNQTVTSPVVLNADTIATVAASEGTLTLTSPLEASGRGLTKVSGGTLAVGGLRAAALRVEGGTVALTSSSASAGPASSLVTLDILSPGRVDLANNKLIVADGEIGSFDGTNYSGLTGRIASAYNFSAWDGSGVFTSMPDAQADRGITTIAIATADEVFYAGGTFGGVSASSGDVLLMYTYAGDLNMDGLVDGADYGLIDNFVQFPGTSGYINGDINYDGVIDGADYGLIDNTIQLQGAPFPAGTFGGFDDVTGVAAVPEPAAGAVVSLMTASMLARRRRRGVDAGKSAAKSL